VGVEIVESLYLSRTDKQLSPFINTGALPQPAVHTPGYFIKNTNAAKPKNNNPANANIKVKAIFITKTYKHFKETILYD
jgi:hypothetical protein